MTVRDIAGKEIKVGDYFVASRKSGNVHALRFGRIVALSPRVKTKMWMQSVGTLNQPDSILLVPRDMVPTLYLESIDDERS